MIRVGFIVSRHDNAWTGGANYIRNLIVALRSLPNRDVEPVFIVSPTFPDSVLAGFAGVEVLRTNLLQVQHPLWFTAKVMEKVWPKRNILLEAYLRRYGIDIVSHHARLGTRSSFPNLMWIPDFQHRRRPDFFNAEEYERRKAEDEANVRDAHWIVLSSQDAQKDLGIYLPEGVAKSSVLRFVSGIQTTSKNGVSRHHLETKYGFSGPYFHLPNQYWAHKNHVTVIRAVALLKQRGVNVTVVSTGAKGDYRHPGFFESIEQLIRELDVADNYRVLGLIDYADMGAMMEHSVALINPSHFEGWSTSVEEAKAMGKAIVLSNIPVHFEQAPSRGIYFDPDSPEELADALAQTMANHAPEDEARLMAQAKAQNALHFSRFGEEYQAIIKNCLKAGA